MGVFIGFIQNNTPDTNIWTPMAMINVWRIPLLFFVSGMGVCFAIKRRTWKQLLIERTRRILVPFLFGMVAIVPIHILIWQHYYNQELAYDPNQGHLWFLKNIFLYVVILSPVFFLLKKHIESKFTTALKRIFSSPFSALLIMAFTVTEALVLEPEMYTLYAMTTHGFVLGLIAFFFGFLFVHSGETFWPMVLKYRWVFLFNAFSMYMGRVFYFGLEGTNIYLSIESALWIFAIFGIGYKYLNRPSKTLTHLSEGAYPIYIVHMIFIYLGSVFILPMDLSPLVKFILLTVFTFAGSYICYNFIIRRVIWLRPLFGLKPRLKAKKPVNEKSTILSNS
jgi:glucan biosynthesis protein C